MPLQPYIDGGFGAEEYENPVIIEDSYGFRKHWVHVKSIGRIAQALIMNPSDRQEHLLNH
jgi:hypothetical protein